MSLNNSTLLIIGLIICYVRVYEPRLICIMILIVLTNSRVKAYSSINTYLTISYSAWKKMNVVDFSLRNDFIVLANTGIYECISSLASDVFLI